MAFLFSWICPKCGRYGLSFNKYYMKCRCGLIVTREEPERSKKPEDLEEIWEEEERRRQEEYQQTEEKRLALSRQKDQQILLLEKQKEENKKLLQEKLAELKELFDTGIITEEEHKRRRQTILDKFFEMSDVNYYNVLDVTDSDLKEEFKQVHRDLVDVPKQGRENVRTSNVKKLGLSGMLIETEQALENEDKFPMEMTLPENKVIMFQGVVVSCFLVIDTDPEKYEVGIEFLDMPEENRENLEKFILLLHDVHESSSSL